MPTIRTGDTTTFLTLLSGTITPSPTAKVCRRDPMVRRADYLQSFRYWLDHPDPRLRTILFAENSDADLSDFHEAAARSSKRVEIISLPTSHAPPGMHYGYSELTMIDQALAASRLRQETSHLIKITGRLTFPALPRLLDKLPGKLNLAVDARSRLPFRPSEHGFISTQLFLTSHEFYDATLRNGYLSLAKEHHYPHLVEHLFFERLAHLEAAGILLRFPVNCEPVGFRGHLGKEYGSPSRLLIARARALSRLLMPRFWL